MPPKRGRGGIFGGNVANPHLTGAPPPSQVPSFRPQYAPGQPLTPLRPMPPPPPPASQGPPRPTPSLANHLLTRDPDAVSSATQNPFLSHAGCGTISAEALSQWLAQNAHISRAFVNFVGKLIGKMRLPETTISMENTTFRAMDLLISTLTNVRREMSFFDNTASKYGLHIEPVQAKPATKGFIDLFASAAGPESSLLEGLVLLWATEHCYRCSWHYASTFNSNNAPSSNYSLPSYMTGSSSSNPWGPDGSSGANNEAHINALHQAFIPNWTSPAFSKFVDACRSLVDEVANSMTAGNGREEMQRCEQTFRQALWLWKDIWPDVTGMGEADDIAARDRFALSRSASFTGKAAAAGASRKESTNHDDPIEVQDDEDGD